MLNKRKSSCTLASAKRTSKLMVPPSPCEDAPRNSFTETDYYRTTKCETHSPLSWAAVGHTQPLHFDGKDGYGAHVPYALDVSDDEDDDAYAYEGTANGSVGRRTRRGSQSTAKPAPGIWVVLDALFRKWRHPTHSLPQAVAAPMSPAAR
uniref:Uncharacterized protein n=1 Tax=Mycena chlorophos TaxID=658473 RepID=A0ABQ0LJQ7_MYCCL|nr:predicted protein [Mycena chlorophos]